MKLFWVETSEHMEDAFIVARHQQDAEKIYETLEGYETGDAYAEFVMDIPDEDPPIPGFPGIGLLKSLGATIVSQDSPQIVRIGGRTYCEGLLASTLNDLKDDILEAAEDEDLFLISPQTTKQ